MSTQSKSPPPPEGIFWDALNKAEESTRHTLGQRFLPYEESLRKCMQAGVEVMTLSGERIKEDDIKQAALFLKRSLNDLRSVWILITTGYLSQAASVAASLVEHALTAATLAGHPERAKQFSRNIENDMPWSVQDMCKFEAKELKSGKNFEIAWREAYSGYKWLCKIKHPTYKSVMHDAHAAQAGTGEFIVMALPDLRPESTPIAATILTLSVGKVFHAINTIAESLNCDKTSDAYKKHRSLLDTGMESVITTFEKNMESPLPFDIADTNFGKEFLKIKETE